MARTVSPDRYSKQVIHQYTNVCILVFYSISIPWKVESWRISLCVMNAKVDVSRVRVNNHTWRAFLNQYHLLLLSSKHIL